MNYELPIHPPFDWAALLTFLAPRAIPGIESVEGDRYRRGAITAGFADGALSVTGAGEAELERIAHLFDLHADSRAIDRHLARDPRLKPLVKVRPGVRVPGAWDAFELAVRAILGQQVSVRGATTLAGRLVAAHGRPGVFPHPAVLAKADLTAIGLPRARAAAISGLAAAVADHPKLFESATIASLCTLPGIGPWTAQYIAMRALHHRDAFPHSDLGLLRAMATEGRRPTPEKLLGAAEAWRPYRAYAAMRLWLQG
jgi:AraC family transcriptional regulator of adaptative response / DNA-3-methyladenine glycosylase II